MRARLLVASGLATVLATGSTALAAPPWSPPRDISAPVPEVTRTSIGFGADGVALVGWTEQSNLPGRPFRTPEARFTALFPDGHVEDRARLPAGEQAQAQVFGGNRTVVLRERRRDPRGAESRMRMRLDASFGTTPGPLLARTRRVAALWSVPGGGHWPALAVSRSGEVAVAWVDLDPRVARDAFFQRHRVRVAISRGGRRFRRPRTLASFPLPTPPHQSVAAAYGRRGELLVAYGAGRRVGNDVLPYVAARLRPRAGRRFGREERVGPRREQSDLAAAAAPNGRMAMVWGSQDGGEEAERPWVVRAAIRAPGRSFGAPAVLDPGETGERVPGRLALAMARDGSATAVWTNVRGGVGDLEYPVRAATALPGAGFGPVTTLAATGRAGSVSAAPDSRMLVTWSNGAFDFVAPSDASPDAFAALRPAGAPAPGAPETISSPERVDLAPVAAFDPVSGRPTAAWPAGVRTPFLSGYEQLRMQLATREG